MTQQCALYIVATPIGNLADITQRAIDVLRKVSLVAAEDTRHSARLLQAHHIETRLISYHDHGGEGQTTKIIERLRAGDSVALISDAGTPLISDPGYRLVQRASEEGFEVIPIPGACALIAALSASGLPSDRFAFEGFPPAKSGGRLATFSHLSTETRTVIFYESTHRILDSLRDMGEGFGLDRPCVVARELSKTFETFLRGTIGEVLAAMEADRYQQKGEFVVMLHGYQQAAKEDVSAESQVILKVLLTELPLKQATAMTAKITGDKKNKLYQWALQHQ